LRLSRGDACIVLSRKVCPATWDSNTNPPFSFGPAFAVKPTKAAEAARRVIRLVRKVTPFLVVIAHQRLVVQAVRFHVDLRHIRGEYE
jgi:hypothetical protein